MTKMTMTVRYKGGAGSGHRGHSGRPGKRGGSSPGRGIGGFAPGEKVSSAQAATRVLQMINADEEMRNLAIALSADGTAFGSVNIMVAMGESVPGYDRVMEEEIYGDMYSGINTSETDAIQNELSKIEAGYEIARAEPGWHVDQIGDKLTPEREEWEKKYYGEVVGGNYQGVAFAEAKLKDYARNAVAEAKVVRPRKLPAQKRWAPPKNVVEKYPHSGTIRHEGKSYRLGQHLPQFRDFVNPVALVRKKWKAGPDIIIEAFGDKKFVVPEGESFYKYS